jgi:hypothetical protein
MPGGPTMKILGLGELWREAKGLESLGVSITGRPSGDPGRLGGWEVAPAVARINCRGLTTTSMGVLTMADENDSSHEMEELFAQAIAAQKAARRALEDSGIKISETQILRDNVDTPGWWVRAGTKMGDSYVVELSDDLKEVTIYNVMVRLVLASKS